MSVSLTSTPETGLRLSPVGDKPVTSAGFPPAPDSLRLASPASRARFIEHLWGNPALTPGQWRLMFALIWTEEQIREAVPAVADVMPEWVDIDRLRAALRTVSAGLDHP